MHRAAESTKKSSPERTKTNGRATTVERWREAATTKARQRSGRARLEGGPAELFVRRRGWSRDMVANTLRAAQQQGTATGGTSPLLRCSPGKYPMQSLILVQACNQAIWCIRSRSNGNCYFTFNPFHLKPSVYFTFNHFHMKPLDLDWMLWIV
jgi:hypothetical protein